MSKAKNVAEIISKQPIEMFVRPESRYLIKDKLIDSCDIQAMLNGVQVRESSYDPKTKLLTHSWGSWSCTFLMDIDLNELRRMVICLQLGNKNVSIKIISCNPQKKSN